MSKKKGITFLLLLTMILSLAVSASAAETTEARVPVTLTVVNTVSPISCTVPAALPVSLVICGLCQQRCHHEHRQDRRDSCYKS